MHTKETYEVGKTYEVSEERFAEIEGNLKNYKDEFYKEVKSRKKKEVPAEEEGA